MQNSRPHRAPQMTPPAAMPIAQKSAAIPITARSADSAPVQRPHRPSEAAVPVRQQRISENLPVRHHESVSGVMVPPPMEDGDAPVIIIERGQYEAPKGVQTSSGSALLDLLTANARAENASDVYLIAGHAPYMKVNGQLMSTTVRSAIDGDVLAREIGIVAPAEVRAAWVERGISGFTYGDGIGRVRVRLTRDHRGPSAAFRLLLGEPPTLEQLGLYEVDNLLEDRGLILVGGPSGSGKTTTLAAMINYINKTKPVHIVTIEDPIEVLHKDDVASINQREIGNDTVDFLGALRAALRQDPDVILIGEMRDTETVRAAIAAAETGHLVMSTLHTVDATETINRVIDFFPPYQQQQVRMSMAGALKGIVSQRLVQRADGQGRVPAMEVLVATGRVFDKIADSTATHELDEIISDGEFYGMQSFDQSLLSLFAAGTVSRRDALATASNPHDLRLKMEHYELQRAEASAAAAAAAAAEAEPSPFARSA